MSKILEEESDVRIAEKKWREQGNAGLNLDDDGDFLSANALSRNQNQLAKSESELFWDNIKKRQANDEKSQTRKNWELASLVKSSQTAVVAAEGKVPAVRPSQSVRAKVSRRQWE